jgi:mannose-6-phosphate isomerase-like protein (cupin superfamily)
LDEPRVKQRTGGGDRPQVYLGSSNATLIGAVTLPKEGFMEVVNLAGKFSLVCEYWSPKIVGELNGQQVKVAKLKGEFIWHHHEHEDELFLVMKGCLRIRLRDREVTINEGEFFIVPKGVEHLPMAEEEVQIVLLEPASTLNTGNVRNERTVERLLTVCRKPSHVTTSSLILLLLGYPDQALKKSHEALTLARELHPFSLVWALISAAIFHQLRRWMSKDFRSLWEWG